MVLTTKSWLAGLLACLAGIGAVSGARAAEEAVLPEIVVTATRTEEDSARLPQSTSVATA